MGKCSKHNLERDRFYHCMECIRENQQKYRDSKKGKITSKKYQRSESRKRKRAIWRQTTDAKLWMKASHLVEYAIRKGKLIRGPCLVCANPKSEAHHYLGYSKEHLLHVLFLCKKHHAQAHRDPIFNEQLKSKYQPF